MVPGQFGSQRAFARERPLEKSQSRLEFQHAAHGGIDFVRRDKPAFQSFGQPCEIGAADHVDVDASLQRKHRRFGSVRGNA